MAFRWQRSINEVPYQAREDWHLIGSLESGEALRRTVLTCHFLMRDDDLYSLQYWVGNSMAVAIEALPGPDPGTPMIPGKGNLSTRDVLWMDSGRWGTEVMGTFGWLAWPDTGVLRIDTPAQRVAPAGGLYVTWAWGPTSMPDAGTDPVRLDSYWTAAMLIETPDQTSVIT